MVFEHLTPKALSKRLSTCVKLGEWPGLAWIAPTLVGTVYGMNFKFMPELGLRYGYFLAIGLMAASSGSLYLIFKKRAWI